jgi:hypothetical protein
MGTQVSVFSTVTVVVGVLITTVLVDTYEVVHCGVVLGGQTFGSGGGGSLTVQLVV